MLKECVVLDGVIINVGPWDYQIESVVVSPAEHDEEGNETASAVYEERAMNPMPEGALIEERDFEYTEDRGWFEVGTTAPKTPQEEIAELKQLVADLASLQLGV